MPGATPVSSAWPNSCKAYMFPSREVRSSTCHDSLRLQLSRTRRLPTNPHGFPFHIQPSHLRLALHPFAKRQPQPKPTSPYIQGTVHSPLYRSPQHKTQLLPTCKRHDLSLKVPTSIVSFPRRHSPTAAPNLPTCHASYTSLLPSIHPCLQLGT